MVQEWDRVVRGAERARGTVRFYGTVAQSPDRGVYLGVEWDDPAAGGGKYDGEIFGTRYFTAAPKSSSFLKVEKVEQGRALDDVLRQRYSIADAAVEAATERERERKSAGVKTRREGLCSVVAGKTVKAAADGSYPLMRNVSASGLPVQSCGDMRRWFPNITDLNLSYTLVSRWATVVDVLEHLPSLRSLTLSHNHFEPFVASESARSEKSFPSLTSLAVTQTNFSWDAVRHLLGLLPELTELNASDNPFTTAPLAAAEAPALSVLRLDRTNVASWDALSQDLAGAGSLQQLHLSGTPLAAIGPAAPGGEEGESVGWLSLAGRLKGLYLRGTRIAEWTSVENLARLGVEALCLTETPLTDAMSEHERRCLVIAQVPGLATLNRSPVTDSERVEAERFFIRYYHGTPAPPPRCMALRAVHGDLLPLAEIDISPKRTADVTVRYLTPGAALDGATETVATVNVYESVGKLAKSVCGALGLSPAKCTLTRIDPEVEGTPLERSTLDPPQRKLYTFRLKDGDVIEVAPQEQPTAHLDPTPH
eukprot:TRINITY_DN19603_c0_g1_i1.p1 TRINITY_DN19603_c0_g1~~TRINITY_DN19603_c0_g1_i1.p1  ORF type:complete len:537 (+),score=169.54 TRINITY_DN19603_c0_g1_i1:77-1687(+)